MPRQLFIAQAGSARKLLRCKSLSLYSLLSPVFHIFSLLLFPFNSLGLFFAPLFAAPSLLLMSVSLDLSSGLAVHSKPVVLKEMDARCPQ